MATGKCPKCEKTVTRLKLEGVDATEGFSTGGWKAVTLLCPSCSTVLGAAIDPIAIKTDIINSLKRT
ncbi:hypothetical protein [Sinorhizobium fredii]|uniref:hypothetical protein n=1 Tax=Rhizobium fredii TaxID=380 RepID=UPI000CF1E455|nr:hypothetical protein [Sinorhizobium fredii]